MRVTVTMDYTNNTSQKFDAMVAVKYAKNCSRAPRDPHPLGHLSVKHAPSKRQNDTGEKWLSVLMIILLPCQTCKIQ